MTTPAVAIQAQGAMGAGIAARLTTHGATVMTSLDGRSAADAAAASQPALSAGFARMVPSMYGKACRRAGEMHEMADFAREDPGAAAIRGGTAALYARLARPGAAREIAALRAFLGGGMPSRT
ncbi:DUF1932 domain-containing protein [Roseomonas rosulenta]|uniref:DUF1932 domain-containing protein n=1 Tax=Roseomonas rosulenta TaxID=2748667 RepID=UPI0018DFE31A|nr:DUF1932 domain-containing protein [Roseomonas rosulenta]